MVLLCSLGDTRMTVMPRLLAAATFSQNIPEELGRHKTAAHHINTLLCEADEPNLLDQQDMHVFGLHPMTDPLHLVRCNACKKPVKASHYATHAELCRSLCVTEETILELDGSIEHRKPIRKERKKPVTKNAKQATQVQQVISESIGVDDTAAVQLSGQIGMASSVIVDVKNAVCLMDGSGGGGGAPEKREHSARRMPRPKKRSKMKAGRRSPPLSDEPGNALVVTKNTGRAGSEIPNNSIANGQADQANQCSQLARGFPMPLATKIYYSQRNNRLRSALNHMFSESSRRVDLLSSQVPEQQVMSPQTSSQRNSSLGKMHSPYTEKLEAPKYNQTLAQSSDLPPTISEGHPLTPTSDFSNQFPVDNGLISQTASVGTTKIKYRTKPRTFTSEENGLQVVQMHPLCSFIGKLVGPMHQPGSVPAV
ncbi:hypothetical protein ACFE04_006082 [Oxalis oulophora]